GSVKSCDQVLCLLHGDVIRPAIDIAGGVAVVRIPQIGSRHVDGRDDSLRHRLVSTDPLGDKRPRTKSGLGLVVHIAYQLYPIPKVPSEKRVFLPQNTSTD